MNLKNKSFADYFLLLCAGLSGLLGLIFYNNAAVMYSLIGLESFMLILTLSLGKNDIFLCLLMIWTTMSQEFAYFLGTSEEVITLYSFKESRILGINLVLIFISLFFAKIVLFSKSNFSFQLSKLSLSYIRLLFIMTVFAIITGALCILCNDNDIAEITDVWFSFAQESSYIIYIMLFSYCIFFVLSVYGSELVEKTLVCIMICNLIVPLIANIAGISGKYGGQDLYLTLSSYILCILIVILPAYQKYQSKLIPYFLLAAVTIIYPLFFMSIAFGKLLIIFLMGILFFLYMRSKKNALWFIISCIVIIAAVVLWGILIAYLTDNNSLFSYKYRQILSLISIWNQGWYEEMLPSPKVRVTEFANIVVEYIRKPWFLFTGKGILGSVKDYMHEIPLFNLAVYSYEEFVVQSYYGMHESINIFFLQSGILGLFFLYQNFRIFLCSLRLNPWIVIGCVWLLLLWGYSVTRSTFGVACFCLGLYLIENSQPSKDSCEIDNE